MIKNRRAPGADATSLALVKLGGEVCAMVDASGSGCMRGGETARGLGEVVDYSTAAEGIISQL